MLVLAVLGLAVEMELGYPVWLLIGRLLVITAFFVTIFGLMGRRKWGLYGFFAAVAAMIPLSVAYNYCFFGFTQGLVITLAWLVRNTLGTAVVRCDDVDGNGRFLGPFAYSQMSR